MMARAKKTASESKVSKTQVVVGSSAAAATIAVLLMLGGGSEGLLGVQFNGTTSNYTTYDTCVNVTLNSDYQQNLSRNITTNSTPPTWVENYSQQTPYSYTGQSCSEAGISIGAVQHPYVQVEKQCLRTNNVLCCWLYTDGGANVASRSGTLRTSLDSGESGICVDLANDLAILQRQGDVSIP